MIRAYIYYPLPKISVHGNDQCGYFQRPGRSWSRFIQIDVSNISTELEIFRRNHYRFAGKVGLNDMWVEVDFRDYKFEIAVLKYIGILLSRHYKPFRRLDFLIHCRE